MLRRLLSLLLLPLAVLFTACGGDPLYVGSDVVWHADHESGDLSAWQADAAGGSELVGDGGGFELTTEAAHGGSYSLKLTNTTANLDAGVLVWRGGALPHDAYYSAWFMIPAQYWTSSYWTIVKFRSRTADATTEGLELRLRSLPGGGYVLYVFDHDRRYLQTPIADPAPIVEPGAWFKLTFFLAQATDPTGRLTVWLGDKELYDLERRATLKGTELNFAVSNIAELLDPSSGTLYVDDAMISLSRGN